MSVKGILQEQFNRVKKLQNENKKFVYDEDWSVNESKIINHVLIGINPGKQEFKNNKFFSGSTKGIINLVKKNLDNDLQTILCLNISNYFTSNKKFFIEMFDSKNQLIMEDIEKNALLLNEIYNKNNNVNIYCLCSDIEKAEFGTFFINKLDGEVKKKIIILKHPSHRHLSDSIAMYYLENNQSLSNIIDVFNKVGKKLNLTP